MPARICATHVSANHVAVRVVLMVVVMVIKRNLRSGSRGVGQACPEQGEIGWVIRNRVRMAVTANMLI